jgi:methyltransferase-like protein/SAM-dependent methyltransferase
MPTLESYDQIPYASVPLPDTHPDHLAVIGRLFGLLPAPPERCRVLELGCASGGNLIPMAWHLPGSEFVGVELSAAQVAEGERLVARLGLGNIALLHRDILAVGGDLGPFDYIIAHGVYSWVPPAVQEKLLQICSANLAPAGIAYVSFNTLPGWRVRGMLRDMLLYHARSRHEPRERLAEAYRLLDLLATGAAVQHGTVAQLLAEEVAYLRRAPAAYLYHEYLEERNEPLLFRTFIERAGAHSLQYLGDTELHTMFASTLGDEVATALGDIDDIVEQEQYIDFVRHRYFRKALLCHGACGLNREIDLETLRDLGAYANLAPQAPPNFASMRTQEYRSPTGDSFRVGHPLAKAALAVLAEAYPNAVPVGDLEQQSAAVLRKLGAQKFAGDGAGFMDELFSLYASQALRLTPRGDAVLREVSGRPRAHALARAQAEWAGDCAASFRHMGIDLDPFARRLLARLDGTLGKGQLVEALLGDIDSGALVLEMSAGRRSLAALVAQNTERLLDTFARNGLLEG